MILKAFPSLDDSMTVVGTISLHLAQIHLLLVVILFFFFHPCFLSVAGEGAERSSLQVGLPFPTLGRSSVLVPFLRWLNKEAICIYCTLEGVWTLLLLWDVEGCDERP